MVRRDASLGVVVEHAQHQVTELEVVGHRVSRLGQSPTPGASRLHAQHLVQPPRTGGSVLLQPSNKKGQ